MILLIFYIFLFSKFRILTLFQDDWLLISKLCFDIIQLYRNSNTLEILSLKVIMCLKWLCCKFRKSENAVTEIETQTLYTRKLKM